MYNAVYYSNCSITFINSIISMPYKFRLMSTEMCAPKPCVYKSAYLIRPVLPVLPLNCLSEIASEILYDIHPWISADTSLFLVWILSLLISMIFEMSSQIPGVSLKQLVLVLLRGLAWRHTQQGAWGRLTSQPGRCFSTRSRTEWRTESQHCSSCPAPGPFWPSARRDSAPQTLRLTCWSWGKALSTGTMLRSVIVTRSQLCTALILMLFLLCKWKHIWKSTSVFYLSFQDDQVLFKDDTS